MSTQFFTSMIQEGVDGLVAEVARLESIANAAFAPAMAVVDCREDYNIGVPTRVFKGEFGYRKKLDDALEKVAIQLQVVEDRHAINLSAIASNKATIEKVKSLMASIGIDVTYANYEGVRGRTKRVYKEAGFVADLHRTFKIEDFYGEARSHLESTRKRILEKIRELDAEEAKDKREMEKAARKGALEFSVRNIAQSLGLPFQEEFNAESVLWALIDSDKALEEFHNDSEDVVLSSVVDAVLLANYNTVMDYLSL